MKVVVFGAGAVGLGIGSCLIESGADVFFVARADARRHLDEHGLRRTGIFGEAVFDRGRFGVVECIDDLAAERIEYVLVCTKSFDSPTVAEALRSARACREDSCKIVLFQNGWGNFEVFAARIEAARVFSARIITGFRLLTPSHVDVTVHADAVKIGSLAGADHRRMEQLAQGIAAGGIPAETTPTIEQDLWAKMLYNCCLNPLGAVLEQNYGILGDSEATRAIMDQIAEETFRVMVAAGFRTHWKNAAGFLEDFYVRLLPATYAHHSSMLQDLKGCRRTEIDAMSGAVVELGERLGEPTPFNRMMRELVRFKESRNGRLVE